MCAYARSRPARKADDRRCASGLDSRRLVGRRADGRGVVVVVMDTPARGRKVHWLLLRRNAAAALFVVYAVLG